MPGHSDNFFATIAGCGVASMLLVLSAASVVGDEQSTSSILKEYRQRIWTKEEGLPDNFIYSILQTRDGYLWIGTVSGLARFDGSKFTVFNQENSPLSTNERHMDLAEQADGGLWIGTANGLLLYQHGSFAHFTTRDGLWDNSVTSVNVGRSGKVWIGTRRGLNMFENGSIKRLPGVGGTAIPGQMVHDLVLYEDASGLLWILSDSMLHKRDLATGRFEEVLHDGDRFTPTSIHEDRQGTIWIGGLGQLFQSKGDRWIRHRQPDDHAGDFMTSILTDHKGNLWFTTGVKGLGRYRDGKFTFYDRRDGLPDDWITRVYEDREGNLWLGTGGAGLVCWQPRRFTTYTTEDGLPDDDVRTIFEDRDGSVWIGTEGGLCQFRDGKFMSYKREAGPQNIIRSIAQDSSGALWLGTLGAGVVCLRNGEFTQYPLPGDRYGNIVRSLVIGNDDSLWIGTGRGLHRLSQSRLTTIILTNAMPQDVEIWGLHFDRAGNLWVGGHGVACISSDGLKASALASDRWSAGLRPGQILSDTNAPGRRPALRLDSTNDQRMRPLQPATDAQSGVVSLGQDRFVIPASAITLFTTTNGLSNDANWALHEDRAGAIWIGNDSGLNRIKDGRISVFTKREGLPDERIEDILEDDIGNFWIAWERGIFRVAKAELNDVAEGRASAVRCVAYEERDTLPDARINGRKSHPAGCKTRDGRLWFPTTKGVVVFDPKKVIARDAMPSVVLESVRADGTLVFGDLDREGRPLARSQESVARSQESVVRSQESVGSGQSAGGGAQASAWSASFAGLISQSQIANRKSEIRLPAANARVMEFDYTACDLIGGDKARFKYRLEGFDSAWMDAGTRRGAFYTNLRPGNYRFQVIAGNHNGVWNETGASLAFYLAPHYSETRWFQMAVGLSLAAGLGAAAAVYARIKRLQHQNALDRERQRIARDMHDQMGSQLSQLVLLSPESGPSATLAREALRDLEQIVWAVKPDKDNLPAFVTRLTSYACDYLNSARLDIDLALPPSVPPWPLSAEHRHHLFLAARELLHNIVKHARATRVRVHVRIEPSAFTLEIADNGRGFDLGQVELQNSTKHQENNGLVNIRYRLAEIGASFQIMSQPGQGTRVTITIPKS